MIKVYGYSDDIVEIEGSGYQEDEIGCYGRDVLIYFMDGTEIRVHYGKPGLGVWAITVEQRGMAMQVLTECNNEESDLYSDVFKIDAEIQNHKLVVNNG